MIAPSASNAVISFLIGSIAFCRVCPHAGAEITAKKKSPGREMRERKRCQSLSPFVGGGRRIRTDGILLAKQTLYQLSYTPIPRENAWWA